MNQPVRTRVAPSPTGDPHVGTIYQALFNYVFAKNNGGQFIVRIEDTDQQRSTRQSEKAIMRALGWSGITWDEGPDIGGPCGPYRQSERTEIYRRHCRQLIENGHAYYCFCSAERLAKLREEQQREKKTTRYDGHCRDLLKSEIEKKIALGLPHVVRMKVPETGVCRLEDLLRGTIEIGYDTVDEQVLMKSDDFPTYHLANVVDDHLMGISHVIRGEEWIPSGPKHLLLYEYFGWKAPLFCHLPLLRNPDKSKLSKRKNPTSVDYYRAIGVIPEALINYLGMMGWTMPDEREYFSLAEMVEHFELKRISLGGPIFDLVKLKWLNGKYIREHLDDATLLERLKSWQINDERLSQLIPLVKKRIDTFAQFLPMVGYLLTDIVTLDPDLLTLDGVDLDGKKEVLHLCLFELDRMSVWTVEEIYLVFKNIAEKRKIDFKPFVKFLFPVISGRSDALPLFQSMEFLGKDLCRYRIAHALDRLGGELKGKALKNLAKLYEETFSDRANAPAE